MLGRDRDRNFGQGGADPLFANAGELNTRNDVILLNRNVGMALDVGTFAFTRARHSREREREEREREGRGRKLGT